RISNTRQIMLILSVGKDDDKTLKKLLNAILERFADITSLYYTINEKKNDVLYDLDLILFHGSEFIEEQLGDLSFKIGPKSFYQTNSYQADKLFKLVKDFSAVNKDDVVFDLYSGLGTIGLFLANDCKEVFCIESVEEAVELGKINAIDNKIDNVSFYCGDMKDEIMNQSLKKPDVVICDPPRAGMHRKVVERLLQFQAEKIVYVSCNVATQARDLELLKAQYDILKSQPVDMFPHTHHIENVVLLKRR
ncbi:MAG: 23S rRNA (uracil(1939)-C(5))-methyltransferase RlmD, partial [Flavobacteriales bacterium]|nr:23S rRNA (uracil(1939)-C(5))-methyltransferase RlmD [Flavobacteriales bacterium]